MPASVAAGWASARDLNRRLERSIESGGATTLVEQPVRIDIA